MTSQAKPNQTKIHRSGDRPLFTASRGLVYGRTHENQAGQRRTDYGNLETKTGQGLPWHTDRGSQYASDSHRKLLNYD